MVHRSSERTPLPPFAGHTLICLAAALVMVLADLIQASLRAVSPRVTPGQLVVAGLHLVPMYCLVAVAAGLVVGAIASASRRSRFTSAWQVRASSLAFWSGADPQGVARLASNVLALAATFGLVAWLSLDFHSRFHRADLAAYVLGAVVVGAIVALLAVRVVLVRALRPLAYRAGRIASIGALAGALVLTGVGAVSLALARHPDVLLAYDVAALAWPLVALAAWALCAATVGRVVARVSRARLRATLIVALALVVVGLGVSSATFGDSNRVRSVVEQRSVLGRRMVRALHAWSDRDGDRFAWAFGGGDCDDDDATIHPGALDVSGDGIDQDCFGGDGAPRVVERGRGRFGRVPDGLRRPNFLVVTIDALRRDHLGAYGYERPTSPNIDAFARTAVDFREVVPQSSRSLRSIPAMWTGNYASEIAFGPEYLWPALLPENHTAAELLRDRGYETSAVMATDYFRRVDGFFQGFERTVQFEVPDPPRDRAVNEALPELRRLTGTGRPWLLWVHLYNCHVPYLQDRVPSLFGPNPADAYDTEITFADRELQRLLVALEETGAASNTVVVLASDHGEGFGEHGTYGHSTTLYQEELRSLLMMRIPGVAPRRVESVVGLLDVAPTLLNLAGVPPRDAVSGESLLALATGEREGDPARPVFAELLPDGLFPYDIKVVRRGEHKLMWWIRDGSFQYFDLATDPEEQHDLSDERRAEAEQMLGDLRAWVAGASRAENRTDAFVARNRLSSVPRTISHPLAVRYPGKFTLAGFELPRTTFSPGDDIPLTFYYRVDGDIQSDLFFLVDVEGPPGVRLPAHFHAWHYPLHSRYPTTAWQPGEVVRDPTPIVVPEGVPAPIRLTLSLRVQDGGQLLEAMRDGEAVTRVHLADIEIVPGGPAAP